eukprot:4905920-Pyramimonas_sp.AAC.1
MELFCRTGAGPRTLQGLAHDVSASRRDVPGMLATLATSLSVVDMTARYDFERTLASTIAQSDSVRPIYYMEYSRYDETSMELLVRSLQYELVRKKQNLSAPADQAI